MSLQHLRINRMKPKNNQIHTKIRIFSVDLSYAIGLEVEADKRQVTNYHLIVYS